MSNVPTAKEFLESRNFSDEEVLDLDVAEEYLVDFAKIHVKAIIDEVNKLLIKDGIEIAYYNSLNNIT